MTEDGLVESVLAELGDARSLAISYGDKDTVVRTRRGEIAVQVARAIGRGTGTFLKWTGIVLGVLLVLGLVTAYVAYQEAKPFIEQEYVQALTTFERDCGSSSCSSDPEGRTVYDRTVTGGADPTQVSERATWNGKEGMWTVTLAYTGFRGTIDLDFYARGLRPGTL